MMKVKFKTGLDSKMVARQFRWIAIVGCWAIWMLWVKLVSSGIKWFAQMQLCLTFADAYVGYVVKLEFNNPVVLYDEENTKFTERCRMGWKARYWDGLTINISSVRIPEVNPCQTYGVNDQYLHNYVSNDAEIYLNKRANSHNNQVM